MLVKYVGPATELHPKGLELESRVRRVNWIAAEDDLPDLTDPATIGCLLAVAREHWGSELHLIPDDGWRVRGARLPNRATVNLDVCCDTEAEALVAALEVAP